MRLCIVALLPDGAGSGGTPGRTVQVSGAIVRPVPPTAWYDIEAGSRIIAGKRI